MTIEEHIQIRDADVYAIADSGNEELKSGKTELSLAALELLVLLDGKSSFAEIAQRTKALAIGEITQIAQMLAQAGYIKPATLEQELNIDFSYFFAGDNAEKPSAAATAEVRGEAESGTAALKINGYYVSIARKSAKRIEPASGADGYITKPYDRDILITGIRAVLGLG